MNDASKYLRAGALLATALFVTSPSLSHAGLCNNVPLCRGYAQVPISFKAFETKTWTFYCIGDHGYYWNTSVGDFSWNILGAGSNFSYDNQHFGVTEIGLAENATNEMNLSMTNWTFVEQTITVTMGCSAQEQPYWIDNAITCPNGFDWVPDPGWPETSPTMQQRCEIDAEFGTSCVQWYYEISPTNGTVAYCVTWNDVAPNCQVCK